MFLNQYIGRIENCDLFFSGLKYEENDDIIKKVIDWRDRPMTLREIVEKFDDETKIVIEEWQCISAIESEDVVIFSGTIGQLKKSKLFSGDFIRSRKSHLVHDYYVDVVGTVQVTM